MSSLERSFIIEKIETDFDLSCRSGVRLTLHGNVGYLDIFLTDKEYAEYPYMRLGNHINISLTPLDTKG